MKNQKEVGRTYLERGHIGAAYGDNGRSIVLRQMGRDANPQFHVLTETSGNERCRPAKSVSLPYFEVEKAGFSDL